MKLDKKFYGEIHKVKNDTLVTEFLAEDDAFARKPDGAVYSYLDRCVALNADAEQIAAVMGLIDRIEAWRQRNPDRLKTPDAKGEKLLP